METKEFKATFGKVAKDNGFKYLYGGWYKESKECIVALDLQRSYYSRLYYLNIKIYIRGVFGEANIVNKYIIKNDMGHIFLRQPMEYNPTFDLESDMDDNVRKNMLEKLFRTYLNDLADRALSLTGLKQLIESGEIYLQSSVVGEELDKKLQEKALTAEQNAENY